MSESTKGSSPRLLTPVFSDFFGFQVFNCRYHLPLRDSLISSLTVGSGCCPSHAQNLFVSMESVPFTKSGAFSCGSNTRMPLGKIGSVMLFSKPFSLPRGQALR